MATYLQGVTDYIPQLQPFQPDLNLYANVLQTKQTQYDTAWKSLNNIYGEYFYADLTRDDNLERKEEIVKNIDFNLKRVSGLDLSLSQNVDQAVQVFKPFYEDQYLMKDMAWTKNYKSQLSRANGYKNSEKPEMRSQYWEDGVKAVNYMREEFKEASLDESLSFGNAEYTPYVNVAKMARQIVKDADINMESIQFSPDGRWVVKKTNGEQVIPSLSKLLESELGNDPSVQAVYKTLAYVNRKDYAYANAAQFGGDKNAAEMKYLETSFNTLREQSQRRLNQLKEVNTVYDTNIADIKKQIENGTATPSAKRSLAEYEYAKKVNDSVITRVEKDNDILNGDQTNTTANTSGFINPYGDIRSLRYKVDAGMASNLMQKDLNESAQELATLNSKVDMDANPYAVNDQKHAQAMQQIHARGSYMLRSVQLRNKGEKENNMDKFLYERGTHKPDTRQFLEDGTPNPNYGRPLPVSAQHEVFTQSNDTGNVTGQLNSKYMDAKINRMKAETVLPQMNNMIEVVRGLVANGNMTTQEANNIFGMNYKNFSRQVNQNPVGFLTRQLGDKKLLEINKNLTNWISTNGKDLSFTDGQAYKELRKSSVQFSDYANYVKESQDWKRESAITVEKDLAKQGFRYAYLLYDNDGNLRSEQEFYRMIPSAVKGKYAAITSSERGVGGRRVFRDEFGVSDVELGAPTKVTGGKAYPKQLNYDDLVKAASQSYTSGKVKGKVAGLEQFGNLSGTGKFSLNSSAIVVNSKAPDAPGMAHFGEILRDLSKFDFKDPANSKVTLTGIGTNWKNAANRNDFGRTLLGIIQADMAKTSKENKLGNFTLKVSPIAGGDISKAAVTLMLDPEYLKQFVYKTDKDKNKIGPGLLSPEAYDSAVQNGISFIMDSNKMSNTMYRNAYATPLKSFVDSGKTYKYTDDLNPNRTLTIAKDDMGLGGYVARGTYPLIDPNTGKEVIQQFEEIGPDPDGIRSFILNDMFLSNQHYLKGN